MLTQAKLDERSSTQLLAVLKDHAAGVAKLQVRYICCQGLRKVAGTQRWCVCSRQGAGPRAGQRVCAPEVLCMLLKECYGLSAWNIAAASRCSAPSSRVHHRPPCPFPTQALLKRDALDLEIMRREGGDGRGVRGMLE